MIVRLNQPIIAGKFPSSSKDYEMQRVFDLQKPRRGLLTSGNPNV